jgi:opacity protein-like surface antigen
MAKNGRFFIQVAGGATVMDIDSSFASNATFTNGALDNDGAVVEVGIGYKYSENIFATFAAQRTMLDIADIDNFYASINYQFTDVVAKPYIGALLGYSQLKWSESPHVIVANEDLTSDGLIYGLQAGFEQELRENWSLFIKYQFIKYDHLMDIRSNASTIEHNYEQNILTGVRYEF